ncbi:MAG: DEAD/DEAH box helicase [Polyangiaceae bacterium]|nr:DEAD/DEAH box helicase [Polyangiaceae bacterium]
MASVLDRLREPARAWFQATLGEPTSVQAQGLGPILDGHSVLLSAPTGSGKTLAAFLAAIEGLTLGEEPPVPERLRVIYVSPLKALAADIEKNLRTPLVGIVRQAEALGHPCRVPTVAIRTGDTPQHERAAFARRPPDILITTPESLYLLLTSEARARLTSVHTVIVDEIHALCGTKRGSHLFLSLERLEALIGGRQRLQRIGLSATQRPLDVAAALLGGAEVDGDSRRPRAVTVVDAGRHKQLELRVEVPIEDLEPVVTKDPDAPRAPSVWPAIHPRLVELIRAHRSTMVFVNSRRLAERLAGAINEAAGEELALAHHGSVSLQQRTVIEERLKQGALPAIVATSSLELGIDMGAVDLVIQIEAPPSVASGVQRVGRAGHSVGEPSRGVIVPKYRGDLLSCAAAAKRMMHAEVEEIRAPRCPLDVLAQQVVAIVAMDAISADELFAMVRRAAPFAELPRRTFDDVLDMLSGRYPSEEFTVLRPRLTWDRTSGALRARDGARRVAVTGGGTIPDRGLYGVFLADGGGERSRRVGELDEEMVFESRVGDVFVLGASSWRIDEITSDRVLVSPAPGQAGRMPFWHGDRPGRSAELGRTLGALARELVDSTPAAAERRLISEHGLTDTAARALVGYLERQRQATGELPSDRTVVIERFVDEVGDYRVCLLSPLGARVHAPWALVVAARYREQTGGNVDVIHGDDGIVFRFPEADAPPEPSAFLLPAAAVRDAVVASLGHSALFSSHFRENAARALLLPSRRPGRRTPLWAQRKRASDLLAAAARHPAFPIVLETVRECLSDVFDIPALVQLLEGIERREITVRTVDSARPSPFAQSLLFGYVAHFMYEGDAPLAERRAQALALDPARLRELLGDPELRELLDPVVLDEVEREVGRLTESALQGEDGLHDLLIALGPLALDEIALRAEQGAPVEEWVRTLRVDRRVFELTIAGERRIAAVEDASRLRDALGVVPPLGIPASLLEPVQAPLLDLVGRYSRTHGPFTLADVAAHFGLGVAPVREALGELVRRGRVVEGEFLPRGVGSEWCDSDVLRKLKQRSLARLRHAVEPVDQRTYVRFLLDWQRITRPARGAVALFDAIEQLAAAPILASELERRVLPVRIADYSPAMLDEACAAGEIVWCGLEALGAGDGRIALYPAEQYDLLARRREPAGGELAGRVRAALGARGASFFTEIAGEVGGYPPDVLAALWELVWAGEVTNDTLAPLRSLSRGGGVAAERRRRPGRFGKQARLPGSEGRWSLLRLRSDAERSTERRATLAQTLLARYGVLPRDAVRAEGIDGGFSAVYPVLRELELAGKARRGYFIAGLGAMQFAWPGAEDRLRALVGDADQELRIVSATDPACPWGAVLPWPESAGHPARTAGSSVALLGGELIAWLGKRKESIVTFEGAAGTAGIEALAGALDAVARAPGRRALTIREIDGAPPEQGVLGQALMQRGFVSTSRGLLARGGSAAAWRERDVSS